MKLLQEIRGEITTAPPAQVKGKPVEAIILLIATLVAAIAHVIRKPYWQYRPRAQSVTPPYTAEI
jgi:hypothetical protein